MSSTISIFEDYELFNLCFAQYQANRVEDETGIGSHWTEFASEDLEDVLSTLSDHEKDEFEKLMSKASKAEKSNFKILIELKSSDFDDSDDFLEEKKNIEEVIMEGINDLLGNYLK